MSSYTLGRLLAPVGIAAVSALVIGGVTALPARADNDKIRPVAPNSLAADAEVATDQFIVRIKEKAGPAAAAATDAASNAEAKTGVPAERLRETANGAQVLKTDRALAGPDAEAFLAALRADADVAYAEPDAVMQPTAVEPNDGLYSLQWDLWEEQAGLRAPGAWTVNRGEGVVVAVVDTGILSHSELDANVLPGYDMLSSARAARDGDGRDPDPTDEGDWVAAGQCDATNGEGISSWHGTHVAGTIAAIGNNGTGVTGVAPEAKILPMRALGPCGGYTSDIADSIVWAAGGVVAGAPANANPARVINLSLGGISACSATYQNAINFAYNSGAAVVVAAGNSNRPAADSSPANCQNVITVGASSRTGARAPYSNYGSVVDVTAPGGDMSVDTWDGILSTSNFGTTSAAEEAYEFQQGTSMAAPHVAGVAALIMSELGGMTTPRNVEDRLKETARPLASTCWYGCGSGLVDAAAALDFVVGEIPVAKMTPAAVTFKDVDGAANDTYTVPLSEGFQYRLNDNVVPAGTYSGTGTVTVRAEILPGYTLADGAVTEWTHAFDSTVAPADVSGPVLVSSSVTPTTFNLDNGPAVIKVSVRVQDQTGVDAPFITVGHDGTGQSHGFGSMTLASGDARDGVWERTVTIPQGAATGRWGVTLYPLRDSLGNSSGGFQGIGTVELSGSPSDVSGPVLVSSSVTPASFNLNDGPAVIKVSVGLRDQTGVNAPYITVGHGDTGQSYGFGSMTLVSGDTRSGVWERIVTIPQEAATGQWGVTLYPLRDSLGNSSGGFQGIGTVSLSKGVRVTPEPVVFTDRDGGSQDTFQIPSVTGVDYLVDGSVLSPGTHAGSAVVTVFARAQSGFVLSDGATAEWSHVFKTTPYPVTPAAVTFTDEDGTGEDTFTVPSKEGVEYLVADKVTAAGTYPGSGTVTVKARATTDYVLAAGATAEWTHAFKATPYQVTPAAVVFTDKDGTAEDTYTVPATEGVEYLAGDNVIAAGSHPGSGTVTVKARATADFVLAAGAATEWSHSFSAKHPAVPGSMMPVTPFRALDTRNGAMVAPDSTVSFQVAGVGGVPKGVSAVVFNMTVAEAKSYGFVTAYASGSLRPDASNLNFDAGQIVANSVTVPVGADGKVTLFNRSAGATHLLADVSGYYLPGTPTAAGAFASMAPTRFLDTRSSAAVSPDGEVSFQVAGVNGIPSKVSAVVLNLTVAEAKSFGFITAYPSRTARPNASNVNFDKGQIIPNAVTVPVGEDGKVTLFNRSAGATHLLADVAGYYLAGTPTAAGTFKAVAPTRFLDTRESAPARADGSVSFQVGGAYGVAADASAVVFNLTVAEAGSFGFITAHASGTNRPNASNVNFDARQIVPNLVTVPVGSDGRVSLFNRSSGATHLLADVSGYFLAG